MVVCDTCFADPDTFDVSEDYLGVFGKGNLPCNAEDNLRADTSSLKPGSGAAEGVLD